MDILLNNQNKARLYLKIGLKYGKIFSTAFLVPFLVDLSQMPLPIHLNIESGEAVKPASLHKEIAEEYI